MLNIKQKYLWFSDDFRVNKSLLICLNLLHINPLSANPTKWSNALKQFCHFVGLALKGLDVKFSNDS